MNYGKKIEKFESSSLSSAMRGLNKLRSGQICRVDAVKKDGTIRTFSSCRTGVSKGVTGAGRKYNAEEKGLITVYEFGVGFRTVAIDRIVGVKHAGVWYDFTSVNRYRGLMRAIWHPNRTISAATSPLYDFDSYISAVRMKSI